MRTLSTIPLALVLACLSASSLEAQRNSRGASRPTVVLTGAMVPVAVSLVVGDARYESSGRGVCRRWGGDTPGWSVSYYGSARDSMPAFELTLAAYDVVPGTSGASTRNRFGFRLDGEEVWRAWSPEGRPLGGGAVSVVPRGTAGRFDIDVRDADGVAIRGTVSCEATVR